MRKPYIKIARIDYASNKQRILTYDNIIYIIYFYIYNTKDFGD